MIKISKNVMISILTLVLTLLALGTTTFAWFTLSKTATISNISANVQAGEGLEVAFGIGSFKTSYRNNLRASDWSELMNQAAFKKFALNAVTTTDLTDFKRMKFMSTPNPGLYDEPAIKNVDYLEFYIHFKSNSPGTVKFKDYLFMDDAVSFTPSTIHKVGIGSTDSPESFDAYASNAARIGIIGPIRNIVVQKEQEIPGVIDNGNTHTSSNGVTYGQFSYLTKMENKIYWGGTTALTEATIEGVSMYDAKTSIDLVGNKEVATLDTVINDYYYSSIKVIIWIEGFDADAYDAIFGAKLQLALSFTK